MVLPPTFSASACLMDYRLSRLEIQKLAYFFSGETLFSLLSENLRIDPDFDFCAEACGSAALGRES